MTLMLAARAHQDGSVNVEKIEAPEPGPGEVLIRVASAGLAPGMMALLAHGMFKHLPTTPGHEAAGTVVAVGPDVAADLIDQRVRVHPVLSCQSCSYCRTDREQMCNDAAMIGHAAFGAGPLTLYAKYHDGGLAEFIRVPVALIDALPDNVTFDVAAKVHDLANAVRALKQANLPLGGTLLVTAATGTMGTATVKLAQFYGAGRLVLVGRSAERLAAVAELAGPLPVETVALDELGADWGETGGLTGRIRSLVPVGVDAVADFIPSGPATSQAMASMRTGGTLVHMGGSPTPVAIPPVVLAVNLWRFVGTRACTRTDATQVLGLLSSGALDVDDLITHRFPLSDVSSALEEMVARREPMWMAVVNP